MSHELKDATNFWASTKKRAADAMAFFTTPEKPRTLSTLWAILGLIAALIAALELAMRDPLGLSFYKFDTHFWIRFGLELAIIILAGCPIFFLIQSASYKAWKDFDFAGRQMKANEPVGPQREKVSDKPANESETRFEYAYTDFARPWAPLEASNVTYQRLRFSAFWYVSSSHIVMGAIVLTLVIGISVYANLDLPSKAIDSTPGAIVAVASRIGIIVLILFLVQILVPLYQYLLRMQAGANARADAMLLCLSLIEFPGTHLEILERARTVLTLENLPFGKAPRPAIKELVDLLKEAKELKKESTKGH